VTNTRGRGKCCEKYKRGKCCEKYKREGKML
jgi:hypothetical protein